jgi:lipopolysaccharide transport system permease protein
MSPSHSRTDSPWRNAPDLLRQLLLREISESIRDSALGLLWLVLQPLLSMALYVVVFGVLFGGRFNRVENESSLAFAVGVYIGLSIVNLINESISKSTNNLQQHSNLVKKVVFPLEILPIVQVLGSGFKLLVNTSLWLIAGCFIGSVLSFNSLFLPVILLPMLGLGLGISALLSAISVYLRDIQQLTQVLTQIVFWSSGVFYSSAKIIEVPQLWAVLKWNPVLLAIENIRSIVLWNLPPDPTQIAYLYLCASFAIALGWFCFHRLKAGFADYL